MPLAPQHGPDRSSHTRVDPAQPRDPGRASARSSPGGRAASAAASRWGWPRPARTWPSTTTSIRRRPRRRSTSRGRRRVARRHAVAARDPARL